MDAPMVKPVKARELLVKKNPAAIKSDHNTMAIFSLKTAKGMDALDTKNNAAAIANEPRLGCGSDARSSQGFVISEIVASDA